MANKKSISDNVSAMQSKLGLIRNEVNRNAFRSEELIRINSSLNKIERNVDAITEEIKNIIRLEQALQRKELHNG